MKRDYLFIFLLVSSGCDAWTPGRGVPAATLATMASHEGSTLLSHIDVPEGYERVGVQQNSFAEYLRNIELQPPASKVHYYDGREKASEVHAAVLKIDVGPGDLQQCADAVMRIRAEYLLKQGRPELIHFNFTNGFRAEYSKWREGYRIAVKGNRASWVQSAGRDTSYRNFRNYLNIVFGYAGTLSLSKELMPVPYKAMRPGDVLIQAGSPGHAVIVMDVAISREGRKVYLLAQSYMPAQEIHILKNPNDPELSPWYALDESERTLATPEWTFSPGDLKRFVD
jgi:hypothetical protein